MFFDPAMNNHGLGSDPFKSLVIPRPIGWISTLGRDGVVNLAPYSFFNAVHEHPPVVMFASGGATAADRRKDSHRNAEETGEFVINLATWELREAVRLTSTAVPTEVDEMALAGLAELPSRNVKPPRVAASPVHLECRYLMTVPIPITTAIESGVILLGEVVGIHIRDDVIRDGRVDPQRLRPIARLGYAEYTVLDNVFTMNFPS